MAWHQWLVCKVKPPQEKADVSWLRKSTHVRAIRDSQMCFLYSSSVQSYIYKLYQMYLVQYLSQRFYFRPTKNRCFHPLSPGNLRWNSKEPILHVEICSVSFLRIPHHGDNKVPRMVVRAFSWEFPKWLGVHRTTLGKPTVVTVVNISKWGQLVAISVSLRKKGSSNTGYTVDPWKKGSCIPLLCTSTRACIGGRRVK